jgi:nucleoside 2-deoxyribosyltransferase
MNYNLTEKQKELCRWIVNLIRDGKINETFRVVQTRSGIQVKSGSLTPGIVTSFDYSMLNCLAEENLLSLEGSPGNISAVAKGKLYKAVDSNFAEEETATPISTLAQPHPPEIAMSLDRLRAKYPDPKKVGFLVMRFTAAKPFAKIVEIIKKTGEEHGLKIIRADETEFHAHLWENVRTHLHGCGFGIAVYERIETNEPNANVGLEVGYLMAMNKPVLLLKDKTVETLQADLAGKLYKQFDPHDPDGTIPAQLTKWLEDYGIIVPKHG